MAIKCNLYLCIYLFIFTIAHAYLEQMMPVMMPFSVDQNSWPEKKEPKRIAARKGVLRSDTAGGIRYLKKT